MSENWLRVGSYVRCVDAGRILLTRLEQSKNPHSGAWTMPGGGMEFGEQPAETALREFHEETGLDVTVGELLGVRSFWFTAEEAWRGTQGQTLAFVFDGTGQHGTLKTDFRDDDTTCEAAWFALDEVAGLRTVPLVDWAAGLTPDAGDTNPTGPGD